MDGYRAGIRWGFLTHLTVGFHVLIWINASKVNEMDHMDTQLSQFLLAFLDIKERSS